MLLSKHQSAWETIFCLSTMPRPLVFVFKKELLYIPFFGWAHRAAAHDPDRPQQGQDAFAHVVAHGKQAPGRRPVDHHVPGRHPHPRSGRKGKYKSGGARLAIETNTPVVPIAMNSGECWPKNSFIKKPGLITVSIGKPISPEGLNAGRTDATGRKLDRIGNAGDFADRSTRPQKPATATARLPSRQLQHELDRFASVGAVSRPRRSSSRCHRRPLPPDRHHRRPPATAPYAAWAEHARLPAAALEAPLHRLSDQRRRPARYRAEMGDDCATSSMRSAASSAGS